MGTTCTAAFLYLKKFCIHLSQRYLSSFTPLDISADLTPHFISQAMAFIYSPRPTTPMHWVTNQNRGTPSPHFAGSFQLPQM